MNGFVFIETRNIDGLNEAIKRHVDFLPSDWGVMIIAGTNRHLFDEYDRMHIVDDIRSLSDYNRMLTSEWFWNAIPYDKVLIGQHDSALLREGIEEFLDWDYVGAPWKFQSHGGNGGLSLRSVRVIKEILQGAKYSPALGYEDVFFCNIMNYSNSYRLAPREICEKFSVETIFKLGTLGYHGIDNWLTANECREIRSQYLNI